MKGTLSFACSSCGQIFGTREALSAHVAEHRPNSGAQPDNNAREENAGSSLVEGADNQGDRFVSISDSHSVATSPSPVIKRSSRTSRGQARLPFAPRQSTAPATRPAWSVGTVFAFSGFVAGGVTLVIAYSWAATHASGHVAFHLFWLGEFIFVAPAAVRLFSRHATRAERLGLLFMLGIFSYLPKLLRDPTGPLFQDELVHWHQTQVMFSSGKIFVPNSILGIIEFFPGLHLLNLELQHITGMSTFVTGSLLLVILHVIALVGVFAMVERISESTWIASIAALIYSLNPSFMFFDSQYSYESLSIVFFIWTVMCVAAMQTSRNDMDEKVSWFMIGIVLTAGCIVTHHLATYILVVALILIVIFTASRRFADWNNFSLDRGESQRNLRLMSLFTLIVIGGAAAWLVLVASNTIAYLAPGFLGGIRQFLALAHSERHSRQLFAGTSYPTYEQMAAYLTPLALSLAALGGLRLMWRDRRRTPAIAFALGGFGLLYFAALPFMLTQSGSEGARRTWAYTYLGMSVLIAPLLVWLVSRVWGRVRRRVAVGLLVVVLGVIVMGNVAVQINAAYMFPGPYIYGSDTRSLTPELLGMARWFRDTQGANQRIVADRYTALALANFGDAQTATPSTAFPIWQLYFSTSAPGPGLLAELQASDYRFMAVDRRMSQQLPLIGIYFAPSEPDAYKHERPVPVAALSRYESLPWASKIYTSDNLDLYRFDFLDYRLSIGAGAGVTR